MKSRCSRSPLEADPARESWRGYGRTLFRELTLQVVIIKQGVGGTIINKNQG